MSGEIRWGEGKAEGEGEGAGEGAAVLPLALRTVSRNTRLVNNGVSTILFGEVTTVLRWARPSRLGWGGQETSHTAIACQLGHCSRVALSSSSATSISSWW